MTDVTESTTLREARDKASIALMDLITDSVDAIRNSEFRMTSHASDIRSLAYAYRLVAGGAQPGSVEVSK